MNEIEPKQSDIKILFGSVPDKIKTPLNKGVFYESGDHEFIFKIDRVCNFLVRNGNEIIIEKLENANDKDIYTFMAGSAFGALLQQRGTIAFHACAIKKNNKAVLLMGKTGVGKSTTALYFYNKGYQIVTDDISVINENMKVENGPPYLKVWYDVLQLNGMDHSNFNNIRDDIEKFVVPISQQMESSKINAIFLIRNINDKHFSTIELKGKNKFDTVLRNIYKPQFAKKTIFEQKSFMALSNLVNTVPVFIIERGKDRFYQVDIENEIKPYFI